MDRSFSLGWLLKWSLFALVGYLLVTAAYPAYMGAWRVQKAIDQVVKVTDGKSRQEIRDELLARPEIKAIGLTKSDVDVSGLAGKYEIAVSYVTIKKLPLSMKLEFRFDIQSRP